MPERTKSPMWWDLILVWMMAPLGFKKIGKRLDPDIIQRKYLLLIVVHLSRSWQTLSATAQAVYASEKARLRRSACN